MLVPYTAGSDGTTSDAIAKLSRGHSIYTKGARSGMALSREEILARRRASNARYRADNAERERERKRRYQARPEVKARRAALERRRRGGGRATDDERVALFIAQLGLCGICRRQLDPDDIEVDHIVPLVKGGTSHRSNRQAAHPRCNRQKGAR